MKNTIAPGFLKKYRCGKDAEPVYVPLAAGFLRLEYGGDLAPHLLSLVSFTSAPTLYSKAVGPRLECALSSDEKGEEVTCMEEEGVSGLQWAGGEVSWGHTFEDDSAPAEGRKVELGDWVDECLQKMINPPQEVLSGMLEGFDLKGSIEKLKDGDEDVRDRFWKLCSPSTEEETALVLELVKTGDGDLIFSCANPLMRASAGGALILDELTGALERGIIKRDYDISCVHEVLHARAGEAGPEVAGRWLALLKAAFEKKGPGSFQAINEGHLFAALAGLRRPPAEVTAFLKEAVSKVASSSASERDGVKGLTFYKEAEKAAGKV